MRNTASARACARWLIVCAVLAGLFLMHGLAAQACPGGTGTSGPDTMVMTGSHTGAPAVSAPAVHAAHAAESAHGSTCIAAPPPRDIAALLALLLLAATAVLAWSTWAPDPGLRANRERHRPPLRTGAELLTTLCVSRT